MVMRWKEFVLAAVLGVTGAGCGLGDGFDFNTQGSEGTPDGENQGDPNGSPGGDDGTGTGGGGGGFDCATLVWEVCSELGGDEATCAALVESKCGGGTDPGDPGDPGQPPWPYPGCEEEVFQVCAEHNLSEEQCAQLLRDKCFPDDGNPGDPGEPPNPGDPTDPPPPPWPYPGCEEEVFQICAEHNLSEEQCAQLLRDKCFPDDGNPGDPGEPPYPGDPTDPPPPWPGDPGDPGNPGPDVPCEVLVLEACAVLGLSDEECAAYLAEKCVPSEPPPPCGDPSQPPPPPPDGSEPPSPPYPGWP